jgi:hypothetical protein
MGKQIDLRQMRVDAQRHRPHGAGIDATKRAQKRAERDADLRACCQEAFEQRDELDRRAYVTFSTLVRL